MAENDDKIESKDSRDELDDDVEVKNNSESKADNGGGESVEDVEEKEKTPEQIIEEYKEKTAQLEDRCLRLAADFENYKKRTGRQYEEILKNSNRDIIFNLLEVLDNFERALAAAVESSDFESLHSGTELVYQSLFDMLKKEGLEPIEAVGEKFDPAYHEAMMQMESEEYDEGIVVRDMVKGYMLKGKVLRYSKVIVSNGKPKADHDEK